LNLSFNRILNMVKVKDMIDTIGDDVRIPANYESEERVIIALDFGTTFSGISYSFPNAPHSKVVTVVDWPG
jgi:hypothetical protein